MGEDEGGEEEAAEEDMEEEDSDDDEEANPFAWQGRCAAQPEGDTRKFVAHRVSGALICELPALGPDTCGLDLHGLIARADGVHPTEKCILLDNTEIAVFDRLKDKNSSSQTLTVVYESLASRLTSPDLATRVNAVWATAKATPQNIESFMKGQDVEVCKALANCIQSSSKSFIENSRIREVSGALHAISAILQQDDTDYGPFHGSFHGEMEGNTSIPLELRRLSLEKNPTICDLAFELRDHFEDEYGDSHFQGPMWGR